MLERAPCCIEPVYELLRSTGHFPWASNLDFTMDRYAMCSSPKSKKTMRLVTIFGAYECQVLWMGASPASDVFQGRTNFTLQGALPAPPKSHVDDVLVA